MKLWWNIDVRLWFTSSRWCSMPIEIRVIPEPCSSLPATSCRAFLVRTLAIEWCFVDTNKKRLRLGLQREPLTKSHHSIASVLPHPALHEAAFAARPSPPQKWGFWGILIKTRGGPVFLMHFAGGPEGVVKNMKNTPPFLIIYRKNHLAIGVL